MSSDTAIRGAGQEAQEASSSPASRAAAEQASAWRAWLHLVWFCFLHLARARQMVWIALALLAFSATLIALNSAAGRWGMGHWRWRWVESIPGAVLRGERPRNREVRLTYQQTLNAMELLTAAVPLSPSAHAVEATMSGAWGVLLEQSGFYVFSTWVVFSIFLSFLLPIWSLSFATEALGSERETRSLVWLLTRPLPRASIYLAKYVALLPWALGLTVGGFGVLCLLAGPPGARAFALYWPAVLWSTLAFCSLFHLLGACFRRAAVVALIYSFFLETILGNMPGLMKRISIGFYTRCMMFDAAQEYGIQPVKPSVYVPVSGTIAWLVLVGLTLLFLLAGMIVFSRSEYQDLS